MKKILFLPIAVFVLSCAANSCSTSPRQPQMTQEQIDSINRAKVDSTRIADSLALIRQQYEDSIKRVNDSIEHVRLHDAMITRIYNEFNEFTVRDVSDIHKFYDIIDYDARIMRQEEDPKIKRELKRKLIAFRVKNYPLARKVWAQSAKNRLWEQDVEVNYSGRTITFTGYVFASNAGIKEVYDNISSALEQLHFKRCNFKWSKYADEYTYYNISSSEDNEVYDY